VRYHYGRLILFGSVQRGISYGITVWRRSNATVSSVRLLLLPQGMALPVPVAEPGGDYYENDCQGGDNCDADNCAYGEMG
jgi:hypothetical protein